MRAEVPHYLLTWLTRSHHRYLLISAESHPNKVLDFHSDFMVTTVTSQKPYNWSDDVIKKAPTVQTRSSSGTGITRGARLELPVAVFNLSIYLFRLLPVFSVRL